MSSCWEFPLFGIGSYTQIDPGCVSGRQTVLSMPYDDFHAFRHGQWSTKNVSCLWKRGEHTNIFRPPRDPAISTYSIISGLHEFPFIPQLDEAGSFVWCSAFDCLLFFVCLLSLLQRPSFRSYSVILCALSSFGSIPCVCPPCVVLLSSPFFTLCYLRSLSVRQHYGDSRLSEFPRSFVTTAGF